MTPKFYRLMATDQSPFFEPVSEWQGVWSGVARVEDQDEINRLNTRKCTEITEAEYDAEVKKKAQRQSALGDFRPVMEVVSLARGAQLADQRAPVSSAPVAPPAPTISEILVAVPVPAPAAAANESAPKVAKPAKPAASA